MNTKKIILTTEQEKYIDDHWRHLTYETMASCLNLNAHTISNYCARNGYRKQVKSECHVPVQKKILKPVEKIIHRPPAEYSNTSREQYVEKWLNVAI